jgi:CubicO group peptidase (beta-lactamase class C family)
MYRTRDWTRFALDIPVADGVTGAGTGSSRFSYCTAGVFLIGQMLERGTWLRFDEFVANRIFEPIGVSGALWSRSPSGEIQSGGQLSMRARDAMRIGQLVLNEGEWNGRRIVPQAWIAEMLMPVSSPSAGLSYGYLWWMAEFRVGDTGSVFDAALMIGNGGNLVVVVPEADSVIVVQARNYNMAGDFEVSRALVEQFILPALLDPDAGAR